MAEKIASIKESFRVFDEEKISQKCESDVDSNYKIGYDYFFAKKSFNQNRKYQKRQDKRKLSLDYKFQNHLHRTKDSFAIRSQKNNSTIHDTSFVENQNDKLKNQLNNNVSNEKIIGELKKNKTFFMNTLLEIDLQNSDNAEEAIRSSLQKVEKHLCSSDVYAQQDGIWKNRQILNLTTKKLNQSSLSKITKLKAKRDQPICGYSTLKYQCQNNDIHHLAIRQKDLAEWFCKGCWAILCERGLLCPMHIKFGERVEGQIYKKGQFLGNWEKRYVIIDRSQGLSSCRKRGGKPTLQLKETNELWSRFEFLEIHKYLIIKLWYGLIKEEFAIPTGNALEWLGGFASLIRN